MQKLDSQPFVQSRLESDRRRFRMRPVTRRWTRNSSWYITLILISYEYSLVGVDYPKGMYNVDLPSKKSLYQLQAERIRRLEQLANEECHTTTATIPWLDPSIASEQRLD